MRNTKTKWKRAPKDQRRVTSDRTMPNARFTRSKRVGLMPRGDVGSTPVSRHPLIVIVGALLLLVGLSVTLVIAVGAAIHADQEVADLRQRAAYYARPTLVFSTLPPDAGRVGGTIAPLSTTPIPGIDDQSSSSSFPELAASDDPRWMHVMITPLAGSFDLRAIPTLLNNEPLDTITQESTGWFITDVEWGVWAQVKLGSVVAWIDTSTVRVTEAS